MGWKTALSVSSFVVLLMAKMITFLTMSSYLLSLANKVTAATGPVCGSTSPGGLDRHLAMDQACLEISSNLDTPGFLKVFIQTVECVGCQPWLVYEEKDQGGGVIGDGSLTKLAVNTTWTSRISVAFNDSSFCDDMTYHFGQDGPLW